MKLTDDFEDYGYENKYGKTILYTVLALLGVTVIVCAVVLANRPKTPRMASAVSQNDVLTSDSASKNEQLLEELGVGESTLTSDQLDFWDMYKTDTPVSSNTVADKSSLYEKNAQELQKKEEQKEKEEDLSQGGTKTKVVRPDGTQQWIMINAYLAKNTYADTGFVYEEPVMKYYANGSKTSFMGVDVDENDGVINFTALKNAGVDFVMVRIGYRGYQSGNITLDNNCYDYMADAKAAGLHVGVYFESQAISVEEAQQEAQTVIDNVAMIGIDYPVACRLGSVTNDTSRVDNVKKTDITAITNAFCARIAEAGLMPVVNGNKYWLLRKIDLTQLGKYDIWLSQDGDKPDYPYTFTMWQYDTDAKIDGIVKDARLDISFVDYTQK